MTGLIFPTKDNLSIVFPGTRFDPPRDASVPLEMHHCVGGEDRLSYATIIWLFEAFRETVFDYVFSHLGSRTDTITRDLNCVFYRPIKVPGVIEIRVSSPAYTERSIALVFSIVQAGEACALLTCSQFNYSQKRDAPEYRKLFAGMNQMFQGGA